MHVSKVLYKEGTSRDFSKPTHKYAWWALVMVMTISLKCLYAQYSKGQRSPIFNEAIFIKKLVFG